MQREIIKIDEELCDGCGVCVPACHEGALQIIDGKVRLISDLFCDGLGACIGNCPQGALTIEKREAEPYNEKKVMEYIVKGGSNVIKAHLEHLGGHNEWEFLNQALEYLVENNIPIPEIKKETKAHSGCPGSQPKTFEKTFVDEEESGKRFSDLKQWPIQMHLVSPDAQYYKNSHLLLAADCCGFAYPDFHKDMLNGKSLAIACPKLDSNKQVYLDKLIAMIERGGLTEITVLIMQVPCCGGLAQLAQQAVSLTGSNVPVNVKVVGIEGDIIKEMKIN